MEILDVIYYSAFFILLLSAVYYYLTWPFNFWDIHGVPYKKPTIIVGNFGSQLLFKKSQAEGCLEMYNWFKKERFFGAYRVRSPMLFVRDPELIKCICVKDFACFMNRAIAVNPKDALSGHLFNLEGALWKGLRSKLTPTFSPGKLKKMFYLLVECSDKIEQLIGEVSTDRGIVEVRELAANFTIDVIGSCAFGIQINALTDQHSHFVKAARKLSKPTYKAALWRMLRSAIPRLYKLLRVQVIDPEVTKFFQDIVAEIIRQREDNGIKKHDFIDQLIELKESQFFKEERLASSEIEINDETIAAQAFVFFVAGFETSSNTIAFCLYELARNPDIGLAARRDINDAIERNNGKLTYDAIEEMRFLEMVVLETLRKYPPAPFLSRRCEQSYRIPESQVQLPPGIRVVIPIYGIHHDPDYYPEPDAFMPERFTDQNKRARHPYTFLPFGEGPRNCIGSRFALLLTKVGVISFLRRYRMELCEKSAGPIKFSKRSLVTASENGIWLRISPLFEK